MPLGGKGWYENHSYWDSSPLTYMSWPPFLVYSYLLSKLKITSLEKPSLISGQMLPSGFPGKQTLGLKLVCKWFIIKHSWDKHLWEETGLGRRRHWAAVLFQERPHLTLLKLGWTFWAVFWSEGTGPFDLQDDESWPAGCAGKEHDLGFGNCL